MKAIICTKYGPPEVLQLMEVDKPTPKDDEVCIRIHATAVTASDCIVRGFKVPIILVLPMALGVGFRRPRQPILGLVFAGDIESVGKDVKKFKNGDAVFGWDTFPAFGAYAEYKCMSEEGFLAIKPANVTYEEAAAVPYGGLLASDCLKRGNIQSGQKVLIYGASGAIGTAAVQLGKDHGTEVTGVCSTQNLEMVRSLGADTVIDYTKEESLEPGKQYDLILDAVGKAKTSKLKSQCKKALAPNGKYVSVDDWSLKEHKEDMIRLMELMEAGRFKGVIDRCYPLEQMAEAHRYVDEGHKKGNVVITVVNEE